VVVEERCVGFHHNDLFGMLRFGARIGTTGLVIRCRAALLGRKGATQQKAARTGRVRTSGIMDVLLRAKSI
jgi:hypothetical protein